ncbi:hypothetical protein Taro_031207 [Colocasia esculenta]|uniref:Uncharacterized protein n=1 Tax=Colocasia esculenta TaxID=4460 RepID=A0A843VU11_COLES|nr:hypothetical protein [Colocasia esculenta]
MALMALTHAQMALEALQPDQLAMLALPLLVLLLLLGPDDSAAPTTGTETDSTGNSGIIAADPIS